jgi:hypothetical protein
MGMGFMDYLAFLAEMFFGFCIAVALFMVASGRWPPEQTERDDFTGRNWGPDDPE